MEQRRGLLLDKEGIERSTLTFDLSCIDSCVTPKLASVRDSFYRPTVDPPVRSPRKVNKIQSCSFGKLQLLAIWQITAIGQKSTCP